MTPAEPADAFGVGVHRSSSRSSRDQRRQGRERRHRVVGHVPACWRLQRSAIAGGSARGPAGDPLGRLLRRGHDDARGGGGAAGASAAATAPAARTVLFSTPDPAYLDKTNATAMHAALGLRRRAAGPTTWRARPAPRWPRCSALAAGAASGGRRRGRVSDLRTGLAGSAEERGAGTAPPPSSAAPEGAVAELVGRGACQRRVPRPLARPGREGLAHVGGALRRGGLRPAGPGGLRRRR